MEIVDLLVSTSASPRAAIIMARVAMNGGSPRKEMFTPLTRPSSAPTRRISIRPPPSGRFIQSPERKIPAKTATSVMPVPELRSMPEVAMTKVAPSAITPMYADCWMMSRATPNWAKLGAAKQKKR